MELHAYDVFMIVVILVATLFGAWKGMAWQLASISALVVSYFVAWRFAPALVPYLPAEAPWNQFLAMLIIYLGTAAGIWIIFGLVSGIIERVKLQEFDQQIGALFGAFKGVVLCVLITFFAVSLSDAARSTILATKSGQWSTGALEVARDVMPPEFLNLVHDHFSRMKSVGEPVGEARVASDSSEFDVDDDADRPYQFIQRDPNFVPTFSTDGTPVSPGRDAKQGYGGLTAPGVFGDGLEIPSQEAPTSADARSTLERGAKEANGLANALRDALEMDSRNANQQATQPNGSQTIR
jgi:membrane protein required for colicin V production